MREIGLFPLGIVLLPGERVPLHIFEPRYRELIGECLEDGVPFGLVLADDSGLRRVGTEATVVEVLERFDDGRLNVVVEGGDRFRVLELTEGRAFATAQVDDLDDQRDPPAPGELEQCLRAYRRVAAAAGVEPEDVDFEAASAAYEIAARVALAADARQELLELTSERDRVVRLARLLEDAERDLRRDRETGRRAASNGRVEPL